jgi:hypothetical protein
LDHRSRSVAVIRWLSYPLNPMLVDHGSNEAYDEATVISQITDFYKLQQLLCYFPDADSTTYPPPDGHAINEVACKHLEISPTVVSLMKKIPYPKDEDTAWQYNIVFDSLAAVYTDEDHPSMAAILTGRC